MEAKLDCDSERIWKIIDKYTPKEKAPKRPESDNIFDNLYNCYIDNLSSDKRFRSSTNLLQKLVPENGKVSFIVSLYSDSIGYSISLMSGSNTATKEMYLPYENDELFEYLDSGEIPPVILEILGKTEFCHMYDGCIICEVRNYRVSYLIPKDSSTPYDSQRILLKPSSETLLMLINNVTKETNCSKEERMILESKVLMATQPPLCLEPETDVTCVQNRLHYNRKKFHNTVFKRYLRRQCHARRSIMCFNSERPHPDILSLGRFLNSKSTPSIRTSRNILPALKKPKNVIQKPCDNEEIMTEVNKYAKPVKSDIIALLEEALSGKRTTENSSQPESSKAGSSGTLAAGSNNMTNKPLNKSVEDLFTTKTQPIQSTDTPTTTHAVKSATPTTQKPRPFNRPRGVYARPVLPGIKVIMGGGNRPIVSRPPPGPPQLRPSIAPRPSSTSVSSGATNMPVLKLLDIKKSLSSLSSSLTSSNTQKSFPLPPLKPQSAVIKTTPTPSNLAMPQLHKLQAQPSSRNTSTSATTSTVGGKSRKRKQKHQ